MARPSATAALLLLALSLLSVVADHDTEPKSVAAMTVSDDNRLSSNANRPAEDGDSETEEKVRPAEQQHGIELLRLPSHRLHLHRHRPCSLHGHLWWKRQHGVYPGAPCRFHVHDHYSGHGKTREAVSHLAFFPAAAEEARKAEDPVAEPDPDRSLPDRDGEGEMVATRDLSSFVDTDAHDAEHAATVRAWKKEVLRRWFDFHFHHGLRRHRLHHVHHDDDEEEAAPETESMNMKRFQFHHHHHHEEDEEEKDIARKRLRLTEHGHDKDSDDVDKPIEEMVRLRRFRKTIMCHGHGRRFFHHNHRHRDAEEAEKQAGGDKQSGVIAWIRGPMNRF